LITPSSVPRSQLISTYASGMPIKKVIQTIKELLHDR
jgi:hypothetical protein